MDQKDQIKIGIIICDRYHRCTGGKCFRALREREGAFSLYRDRDASLVGYATCDGCPGGNIEYAPEEMVRNGANVIHLATGLIVGYPPCPRTGFFRDFIQARFGIDVVFGTHPIPQKYYLVHHDLRTWDAPLWQEVTRHVMADGVSAVRMTERERWIVKTKPFLYRYVYGPVPSKRLGRSLGVDLAPFKRCTYDCIYCQLGRTTDKTTEPKSYATSDAICSELERKLSFGPPPDYISLAGSGEPTLNAGIGELIAKIKGMTNIPVAVLTNGSLLWRDEVRTALIAADLVLPSLDAGDEEMFQYVNRPHRDISFERMITGLVDFVRVYPGAVWLEVFLLAGVTAIPSEIKKIDALLGKIRPARVQLNTVTRPPAEEFAYAVSKDQMESLKGLFSETVEIISRHAPAESSDLQTGQSTADIISLLKRRPCTLDGISSGLAMQPGEALKHLDALCRKGAVTVVHRHDGIFYKTNGK